MNNQTPVYSRIWDNSNYKESGLELAELVERLSDYYLANTSKYTKDTWVLFEYFREHLKIPVSASHKMTFLLRVARNLEFDLPLRIMPVRDLT
jgi:hypothetical protein